MAVSFKRPIRVEVYTKTPSDDLVFCTVCGGINALGRVAKKIDCENCDGTGYENFFTIGTVTAYYIPGGIKQYDPVRGGVIYQGNAGLKVDAIYESVINGAEFIKFEGIKWQFTSISDPGRTMGQRRLLLALSRKE